MLEPVLNFPGVQIVEDGQTILLKDVRVPALQKGEGGFGPTVVITTPTGGSTYVPGTMVEFTGGIADGVAPYNYQWFLDDGTPLSNPMTSTVAGEVVFSTDKLPTAAKDSAPGTTTIVLRAVDAEGVKSEALVTLRPSVVPKSYLPVLLRHPDSNQAAQSVKAAQAAAPARANANFSFGIEAASDYTAPGWKDLPAVIPDANGMRDGLNNYGWGQSFYWSNANVWEKDFRDCSLGGGDCTYGVDRADLVYFSGHGVGGGIAPSNPSRDTAIFDGMNARYQNVRWLMLSSCQGLRITFTTAPNEPMRRWFNAFQGASMILGFNSNMRDVAFGPRLMDNLRMPTLFGVFDMPWAQLSIRDAWVKTAFDMNAGKPAYLWATSATYDPVNNKLPRAFDSLPPRPRPVNWFYWVWWDCQDADPKNGLCEF